MKNNLYICKRSRVVMAIELGVDRHALAKPVTRTGKFNVRNHQHIEVVLKNLSNTLPCPRVTVQKHTIILCSKLDPPGSIAIAMQLFFALAVYMRTPLLALLTK